MEEDFKTQLLKNSTELDQRLSEVYTKFKIPIDAFFERLEKGEVKRMDKLSINGEDLQELMKTVEIMSKNSDTLQELVMINAITMKTLQMMVYSVMTGGEINTGVKLEVE